MGFEGEDHPAERQPIEFARALIFASHRCQEPRGTNLHMRLSPNQCGVYVLFRKIHSDLQPVSEIEMAFFETSDLVCWK